MNAITNSKMYDSTNKLYTILEAKAAKAIKVFEEADKTGFLRVGQGKAIHLAGEKGNHTLCFAEGAGSGQIIFQISPLIIAEGPATCKRCLKYNV